jgi:hypothetical protein
MKQLQAADRHDPSDDSHSLLELYDRFSYLMRLREQVKEKFLQLECDLPD